MKCPRCEAPITGHGRVFCGPCAVGRTRIINRNRMMAVRQGQPAPPRACVSCPATVNPGHVFCTGCAAARERAYGHAYNQRPEVKAKYRERASQPRQKLIAYARDQRPESKARKRARDNARYVRTTPYKAQCQTLMCDGTFTRNKWNGRRMFCNPCRWAYGYVSMGWPRPGRRRAA